MLSYCRRRRFFTIFVHRQISLFRSIGPFKFVNYTWWETPFVISYFLSQSIDDLNCNRYQAHEIGGYPNRDTSSNAWNHQSGSSMVDKGILFRNIKSPSPECSMTFWHSTCYNDFLTNQTFHKYYDLGTDLNLRRINIARSFNGAFATDVACQQGTLTLPDNRFRHFLELAYAHIVETSFTELTVSFLEFHLEYPSVRVSETSCFIYSYVTAHRCAGGLKKNLDLRSAPNAIHLVGFFNVPFQAPTRASISLNIFSILPR